MIVCTLETVNISIIEIVHSSLDRNVEYSHIKRVLKSIQQL